MKTRIGLFLVALALTAAAILGPPQSAEAACKPPYCFASPGCCFAWQCDDWCGLPGMGICGGGGQGGCCSCAGWG